MSAHDRPVAERFITFQCKDTPCLGVLSMPAQAALRIGVVIVVGGPQYRVGSHRQFVELARGLAVSGVVALRFDYRGMGDSAGDARTFESVDDDLRAAVDALVAQGGVERVVLWGLCDGASACFMYAWRDPRVAGIVALNPWARSVRGEASARLRHYYMQRLRSREFWRKLMSGRFDPRASAGSLVANVRNAAGPGSTPSAAGSFLQRMEEGWRRFRRPALLVLSGNDLTAREFEAWVAGDRRRRTLMNDALAEVSSLAGADHTLSDRASREAVARATVEWISRLSAA
jgi:uncharacterized protein